ncbi:hypothetical protein, partial [Rhodomicrobium udaipurense]
MEFIIAGIALVIGFIVGVKASQSSSGRVLEHVLIAQAHDRHNLLATLQRELANLLIWRDPERFKCLY